MCLMEYAAAVAGEHRSDSPGCTDPALAAVARAVNDFISAAARDRLAPLAAGLVRCHGAGAAGSAAVVRRTLITALPVAPAGRQKVLAVALCGHERAAAGHDRGWRPSDVGWDADLALVQLSDEGREAAAFVADNRVSRRDNARRGVPLAVEEAVRTIADNDPDADVTLHRLLVDCIEDYLTVLDGGPVERYSDEDMVRVSRGSR